MMIDEFLASDKKILRPNYQKKYLKTIKLAIIPVQQATVLPFLYDIGEGRVFGENCVVDVYFFDSSDRREDLETLAASVFISAFPWIRNIIFPETVDEALKGADYVILNPRLSRKKLSFKYVALDQGQFFTVMGKKIDELVNALAWVVIVTPSYTSLFCHIMKSQLSRFPYYRITGLKRNIEVLATNMIANKLDVPPDQIRGITVWGENILDFQMSSIDTIYHERKHEEKDHLTEEDEYNLYHFKPSHSLFKEHAEELCKLYHDSQDKNKNCTYCQSTAYAKQRREQLEEQDDSDGAEYECTPQKVEENKLAVKQQTIKELQDEIMEKIAAYLNSKKTRDRGDGPPKINEKELLELYQKGCLKSGEMKDNYQCDKDNVLTNILPLTQMIENQYWLMKYLPKICLKASSKTGGSIARCLAEHINFLHEGTKKPFSITACVDEAYEFPRGLYCSGPGIVDTSTGRIIFFPFYEMSENTQLKLFRQMVKLKKQCEILDTNFWNNEEEAFDTKRMPILDKDELGIARDMEIRKQRLFMFSKKKPRSMFDKLLFGKYEPTKTVNRAKSEDYLEDNILQVVF
ncbi:hypothetical protein GE061_017608 [Apolygus lucorum]|uniref:Lactate/malate dehydrogenase C-terminal domain-containing protein n=1 Tax=Apolygus lucorum TaxID=248454 RepID=A0A8S9XFH8_APOLU|nr:hypothetical protein GE061_017608 [Apolygus lucorum]